MSATPVLARRLARGALWSALPLALVVGAVWLLGSETGLRFALARARGALGPGFAVAEAHGTLTGPLELTGLELRSGGTRITVAHLRLDLRTTPLLLGRLQATGLEADGVRVRVVPDPDAAPFVLPDRIELPVHVALERFELRDVEFRVGDAPPAAFARIGGTLSADVRGLRLDALEAEHAQGTLRGRAAVGLAQPYPAEAAFALSLRRPDGSALPIEVAASGRLEALRLHATAAAPLALEADLTLRDAFTAPRVDGTLGCVGSVPAAFADALAALGPTAVDCALSFEATGARAALRGRVRATHPRWRPAVADVELALTPRALVLERGALRFEGAALTATANGRIALDGAHRFALRADARALGLPSRVPGPVLAAAAGLELEGDLDAARATLTVRGEGAGAIEGTATLAPRARRFALDGTARGWALAGAEVAEGAVHAEGDATGADLTADAVLVRDAQRAALHAAGRLTPEALALDALRVDLLGGRVEGRAWFGFADGSPRWRATLAARDLDPRSLDARFRGRIGGTLAIEGDPRATTIELRGLEGTLRERALGGGGRLRYAPAGAAIGPWFAPTFALERLALTSGSARLEAAFDARHLRLALEAPDLADLLPSARGRLALHAALTDDAAALDADGAGVVVGPLRIVSITADVRAPAAADVTARLALLGLDVGDLSADELVLAAHGPRPALVLSLDARRAEDRIAATARGALAGERFAGTLERLDLTPATRQPAVAPWALTGPSALRIGRDGLHLAEACLSDGAARGCLAGGWHPVEPWRVTGKVQGLPFGAFGAFGGLIARGLEYHGTLDLDLEATGRGPTLTDSRAVLALSAGSIKQPARRLARRRGKDDAPPLPTTLLDFGGGRIELTRRGPRTGMDARFALVGGGRLEAVVDATGAGPFQGRALQGRVTADVSQFALLPALLPELKSLAGRVVADVALSGTVGDPRFAGRIAFEDGSATMPQYGLELSELAATLEGSGDALALSGQARSGGLLQWRADIKRQDGRWRANGRLWGERVKVLETPEAKVFASPALVLDLDGDDLKLTGEVAVPRARLAPRSLATAVQATGDEVIVDPDGAGARADALQLDAKVRLKLGDEVAFDGFGLTAKVRGEITVTERPGALAIASGDLALADGKYEAYGQNLAIERGRLLFSGGPVTNPGLDVRAKRTVERPTEDEDVIVGIDVRGTLRSPETTIFATPAMSSSDALAYLVVGRSLADSTDAQQSQLSDAASSMKLSGGEFLAQQIGRRIGLDEVRVSDADNPEEAQLWLGTYLSPRLFVSYGMGLFEQFHTARVRYQMSKRWSVEAESGRESSADVKYTIER